MVPYTKEVADYCDPLYCGDALHYNDITPWSEVLRAVTFEQPSISCRRRAIVSSSRRLDRKASP